LESQLSPGEDVTTYPSIMAVKTFALEVFGGILNRQDKVKLINNKWSLQLILVIVDLYPLKKTVGFGDFN
jgi:AICAR transformylase/IMP cyclohydrolase PurH